MRCFPLLIVAVALLIPALAEAAAPTKKYNVLMIVSDDLTPRLGHLGYDHVKSPHLDKLASQGVSFAKAYCQYPLCAPSRASFMSGRYPETTGVLTNAVHLRDNLPDAVTMGQMFQQAGYFSGRVGKIFHYGVPKEIGTDGAGDDEKTWNQRVNPAGIDVENEDSITNIMPKPGRHPDGRPSLGAALSYRADDGGDLVQTDGKIALETIRMIEANKSKPFFIACGFFRPHVPNVGPKEYWKLYPLESMQLPKEPKEHIANVPPVAFYVKPGNYGIEEQKLREFLQGYYATVSFMDAQVGRLMDALDKNNLRDNTIVVFFADHGWLLGEHGGQWQKMSLFEWSARVPLIISVPGAAGNGKISPRTVELLDVYPTLADFCGIKPPANLDGQSLRPLLEQPDAKWDHPAFTQVTRGVQVGTDAPKKQDSPRRAMGRSIRTDQFRYTYWEGPGGGEELYDHDKDPNEWNNLANDPQFAAVKQQLRARMEQTLKGPYAPFSAATGNDAATKGKGKGKKKQ